MQKQTSIYIPKPCNEDWNKMTTTQQGKFCASCNKQVVDFSLMSDNQILNFLSHRSGKLCGRFDAEQLQRPLIETKIKKQKSWWMALVMPLLFLFERSEAQRKVVGGILYNKINSAKTVGKLIQNKAPVCEPPKEFTGTLGMIVPASSKQIIIKGNVVNETDEPIPFATLTQKGTKNAVAADAYGRFSIVISNSPANILLNSSAVGFESIDTKIDLRHDSTRIIMKSYPRELGGVVVVVAGGISSCHKVKKIDTVATTIKKILKASGFKVYPNPVQENGFINIQVKDEGNYQMQLLDNQSQLVQAEEINADTKNAITQIQLPSNIAAGIYYLRLINERTKKPYTEKLIIE